MKNGTRIRSEEQKVRDREKYKNNKQEILAQHATWRANNKQKVKTWSRRYNANIKLETLSHYGPEGKLQCTWPECAVVDPDMLSLDHIFNNGAKDRKLRGTGVNMYGKLKREGFPEGFQTLCHNHQWKKELMYRRNENG